jgi:hypothetical protein
VFHPIVYICVVLLLLCDSTQFNLLFCWRTFELFLVFCLSWTSIPLNVFFWPHTLISLGILWCRTDGQQFRNTFSFSKQPVFQSYNRFFSMSKVWEFWLFLPPVDSASLLNFSHFSGCCDILLWFEFALPRWVRTYIFHMLSGHLNTFVNYLCKSCPLLSLEC